MADGECDDKNALHISSNDPGASFPWSKSCAVPISRGWRTPLRTDIPLCHVHVDRDAAAMGCLTTGLPNKDDVFCQTYSESGRFFLQMEHRVSQINDGANTYRPRLDVVSTHQHSGNISSSTQGRAVHEGHQVIIVYKAGPGLRRRVQL